tara:strand:+ start:4294 stop:5136 length:843 start_codon:yes stop_codon:yes gene_type:complete
MIIIDKQTPGRHGNKLFHFNTLMQLSEITGQAAFSVPWQGFEFFKKSCHYFDVLEEKTPIVQISHSDLIHESLNSLKQKYSTGHWKIHSLSLHGPFFRITKKDPREYIKLTNKPTLQTGDKKSVGIHIRGGDTRGADGMNCREIHQPEYYKRAIEYVLEQFKGNAVFFLCTDDPDENFPSYKDTLDYLIDNNLEFYHDPKNHYIKDFSILSECDAIIAGSSTFVLAAGMIGKHKKMIHSKDFVEQFKNEDQKWYSNFGNGMFFHDMNHMKSDYYDVWALV